MNIVDPLHPAIELEIENFDREIESGLTLVIFWAWWCYQCRQMRPVIKRLALRLEGTAKVGKCDIDYNEEMGKRFEIEKMPTLVIFESGCEVERLVGVYEEDLLMERMDNHLK